MIIVVVITTGVVMSYHITVWDVDGKATEVLEVNRRPEVEPRSGRVRVYGSWDFGLCSYPKGR